MNKIALIAWSLSSTARTSLSSSILRARASLGSSQTLLVNNTRSALVALAAGFVAVLSAHADVHISRVASARTFTVFLKEDSSGINSVWVAGSNDKGQLGPGATGLWEGLPRQIPFPPGVTSFKSVAAQQLGTFGGSWGYNGPFNRTIAVGNNKCVYAWGTTLNGYGTGQALPGVNDVLAVYAGASAIFAIREDRSVVCWTNIDRAPLVVPGVQNARKILFKEQSPAAAWILTESNQIFQALPSTTDNSITVSQITAPAGTVDLSLSESGDFYITQDGTAYLDAYPSPVQVEGVPAVRSIFAQGEYVYYIEAAPTGRPFRVRTIGSPTSGYSVPFEQVLAGNPGKVEFDYAHLLQTGESIAISGATSTPSINGIHTITAIDRDTISLNGFAVTSGSSSGGKVRRAGAPEPVPNLPTGVAYEDLVGGRGPCIFFVDAEGLVFAAGENNYGQVGSGFDGTVRHPRQLPVLKDIASLSVGKSFVAAKDINGKVFTWGNGNRMVTYASVKGIQGMEATPTQFPVPFNASALAVAAGGDTLLIGIAETPTSVDVLAYGEHYGSYPQLTYSGGVWSGGPAWEPKAEYSISVPPAALHALESHASGAHFAITGTAQNPALRQVHAWGLNPNGLLGRGLATGSNWTPGLVKLNSTTNLSDVSGIHARQGGMYFRLGTGFIKGSGYRSSLFATFAGTQNNYAGSPLSPLNTRSFLDVAGTSSWGALGVESKNGTYYLDTWGAGTYGDVPTNLPIVDATIRQVATTARTGLSLHTDGTVKTWGNINPSWDGSPYSEHALGTTVVNSRPTPGVADAVAEITGQWGGAKIDSIATDPEGVHGTVYAIRDSDRTVWMWGADHTGSGLPRQPLMAAIRLKPSPDDANQNGVEDSWEITHFGQLQSILGDFDKDGLPDTAEWLLGSNPKVADTDGDGFQDGGETIVAPTITTTILNDVVQVSEFGTITVECRANKKVSQNITVPLVFSGTAAANDYSLSGGASVTIPAGQSVGTKAIQFVKDNIYDDAETLVINVEEVIGVTKVRPAQFTVLIKDELPAIGFNVRVDAANAVLGSGNAVTSCDGFTASSNVTRVAAAINGRPELAFAGSASLSKTASFVQMGYPNQTLTDPQFSFVAVCRTSAASTPLLSIDLGSSILRFRLEQTPPAGDTSPPGMSQISAQNGSSAPVRYKLPGSIPADAYQVLSFSRGANGVAQAYLNGAKISFEIIPAFSVTPAFSSFGINFTIGGQASGGLRVSELVSFPRALTATEQQDFTDYYKSKFGETNAAPGVRLNRTIIGPVTSFSPKPFFSIPASVDDGRPAGTIQTQYGITLIPGSALAELVDHDSNPATPPRVVFDGYGACDVTVTSSDGALQTQVVRRFFCRPFAGNPHIWVTVDGSESMGEVTTDVLETVAALKLEIGPLFYESQAAIDQNIVVNAKGQPERWLNWMAGLYTSNPAIGLSTVPVGDTLISLVYSDENSDAYHSAGADSGPTQTYIDDYTNAQPLLFADRFRKGIVYAMDDSEAGFLAHLNAAINQSKLIPGGAYAQQPMKSAGSSHDPVSYQVVSRNRTVAEYKNDILTALGYPPQ